VYVLTLAGQVIVVSVMGAVSYWGSKKIDPETRIRARTISLDSTMRARGTALVWPPVIGFVILLGTLAVNDSPNRVTVAALGLGVLLMLLLAHWSTVKRAAR
jgi:hypothetical protein